MNAFLVQIIQVIMSIVAITFNCEEENTFIRRNFPAVNGKGFYWIVLFKEKIFASRYCSKVRKVDHIQISTAGLRLAHVYRLRTTLHGFFHPENQLLRLRKKN